MKKLEDGVSVGALDALDGCGAWILGAVDARLEKRKAGLLQDERQYI